MDLLRRHPIAAPAVVMAVLVGVPVAFVDGPRWLEGLTAAYVFTLCAIGLVRFGGTVPRESAMDRIAATRWYISAAVLVIAAGSAFVWGVT